MISNKNQCECNCQNCKNYVNYLKDVVKKIEEKINQIEYTVNIISQERDKKYSDLMEKKCEALVILSNCKATTPDDLILGECNELINLIADYISKKTDNVEDAKLTANCFNDLVNERGMHYGTVAYAHDVHWSKSTSLGGKYKNEKCWDTVGLIIKMILDKYYKSITKRRQ